MATEIKLGYSPQQAIAGLKSLAEELRRTADEGGEFGDKFKTAAEVVEAMSKALEENVEKIAAAKEATEGLKESVDETSESYRNLDEEARQAFENYGKIEAGTKKVTEETDRTSESIRNLTGLLGILGLTGVAGIADLTKSFTILGKIANIVPTFTRLAEVISRLAGPIGILIGLGASLKSIFDSLTKSTTEMNNEIGATERATAGTLNFFVRLTNAVTGANIAEIDLGKAAEELNKQLKDQADALKTAEERAKAQVVAYQQIQDAIQGVRDAIAKDILGKALDEQVKGIKTIEEAERRVEALFRRIEDIKNQPIDPEGGTVEEQQKERYKQIREILEEINKTHGRRNQLIEEGKRKVEEDAVAQKKRNDEIRAKEEAREEAKKEAEWELERIKQEHHRAELDRIAKEQEAEKQKLDDRVKKILDGAQQEKKIREDAAKPTPTEQQQQDPFKGLGPFARAQLGQGGPIGKNLFDPFAFAAEADFATRAKIRGAHQNLPQFGQPGAVPGTVDAGQPAGPEGVQGQVQALIDKERAKFDEKDIRGRAALLAETDVTKRRADEFRQKFGMSEAEFDQRRREVAEGNKLGGDFAGGVAIGREEDRAAREFQQETRRMRDAERRRIERQGRLTGQERAEAESFFGEQAVEAVGKQIEHLEKNGTLTKNQADLSRKAIEEMQKQSQEMDQFNADVIDLKSALDALGVARNGRESRRRAIRASKGN